MQGYKENAISMNAEIPASIIQRARDRNIVKPDRKVRTADGAGIDDLNNSLPTTGSRVLKWIPLPRSWIALDKCYNETDSGRYVQNDAECHD